MSVSASSGAAAQVSSINLQDFLKILSSQLTNQNPLKPLDNQEFVAQIAQFSTLQQSTQLNAKIDQMLSLQSVTQSVGLIGKVVGYNSSGNSGSSSPTTVGRVTGIDFVSGQARLTITTAAGVVQQNIALSQIISAQ